MKRFALLALMIASAASADSVKPSIVLVHGAFADAIFKEDNRDLAHGSFDYANELNVEILRMEACQLSLPPIVRAHRTDVSSLQTKLRAGRKRSRHLSAGFHANFLDVNLTVWFRKSRHDADRVHGI